MCEGLGFRVPGFMYGVCRDNRPMRPEWSALTPGDTQSSPGFRAYNNGCSRDPASLAEGIICIYIYTLLLL